MLNVKPLLNSVNIKTFISDYLHANGIQDVNKYLYPDASCFDNPKDYPNIDEGAVMLKRHIDIGSKIGVLADSDLDGQSSACIMVDFLQKQNANVESIIHIGKQHGLKSKDENIVQQVIDESFNLLITPDAGTNDVECHKELKQNGIDCLVLDHHLIDKKNPYKTANNPNPYAVIINHNLGVGLNTALSGCGVTNKFVRYYCTKYNLPIPNYNDLVATSLVSDVCDLSTLENRAYIDIGLTNTPTNPMLELMFKKSCKKGINPEGLSWGCNPLVNSLCRGDAQEDKRIFFEALVGNADIKEGLKVANRAHRVQTNMVKKAMEELQNTLDTKNHKVIIGFVDKKYKSYTGLIANKVMSQFGKPTVILRESNPTTWSGSIRSTVPLAEKITETEFATCQGHSEAAGIYLKKSNLEKLITWFDTLDLSVTPDVPVTAIITPKQIDIKLVNIIDEWKILWGEGLPKPTFSMDINVDKKYVNVYRKNTNTIKTFYKGIDILMFFANEDDIKAFENGGKCRIVFDISKNEWNGNVKPQCIISQYEFIKEENNENDWMDDF